MALCNLRKRKETRHEKIEFETHVVLNLVGMEIEFYGWWSRGNFKLIGFFMAIPLTDRVIGLNYLLVKW
jgi:hypothetical protein